MPLNCETTLSGRYQFSYEDNVDSGGICDAKDNTITTCQGDAQITNNTMFTMNFGKCDGVATFTDKPESKCFKLA